MMNQNVSRSMVREIMTEFANQTGLLPATKSPRRYLWTDAFAVCTFLELYRQTNDEKYKNLALRLVDQVHSILGRHREDDPRTGWISGLDEEGGKIYPTKGGLRIGKEMEERRSTDPFDEQLEWDRDGQYYHYLTKWMHALNRVSRVTGDLIYNTLAMELAKTAHARFTYIPSSGGQKRMYWKMTIDLSYPLVESMGHHFRPLLLKIQRDQCFWISTRRLPTWPISVKEKAGQQMTPLVLAVFYVTPSEWRN